jgi:hypothetical protein
MEIIATNDTATDTSLVQICKAITKAYIEIF